MKRTCHSSSFFTYPFPILNVYQRSKQQFLFPMTRKILVALSLAASLIAVGAAPALGQTTGTTLTCTPISSSVPMNQNVSFLLNGGNGTFAISGSNVTPVTTTSTVFSTSFGSAGVQSFTVSSGGQVTNCNVTVNASGTTPLICVVPAGTLVVGTPATFTVTGGNGTFSWSSPGLSISNPSGTSFTANFSTAGIHTVTVTSGNESATCGVNVQPAAATGGTSPTLCSPVTQTATAGQQVTFSATGGNGSYVWSSSDLTISNPTGAGFRANYTSAGIHTITVTSGGTSSSCSVTVLPVSTPGFPNTGFAPVQ